MSDCNGKQTNVLNRLDSFEPTEYDHSYQMKLRDIYDLMSELDQDPVHAAHVSKIAVTIFDQLSLLHCCATEDRFLLESAALLHDIGWSICGRKHHKHSMSLILQSDFPHLDEREKQIVANVARYHRRTLPKLKHAEFALLTHRDQQISCKLASILRIADALDKTHSKKVNSVECSYDEQTCLIRLNCNSPCQEEILAVEKKKNLFERIFSLKVQLEKSEVGDLAPLLTLVEKKQ